MFDTSPRPIVFALGGLLYAGAQIAQAQVMEEIMVTAQKREQAITDVSLTMDAFGGERIRDNGIDRPQDVAFLIPNVDIKGSAQGEANPTFTIRGIGQNNFNSNNNQSVGVYVNGVGLSSAALMSLSMMDVERIEVLKGPQGTLYGRNSSGGAINIISARPSQELDGFASLSAGDFDQVRFEGAVGRGLSDTVAGRVSVLYDNQDESYHDNALTGTDFGDAESWGVRGQLGYAGTQLSANLAIGYMEQDAAQRPFTHFGMLNAAGDAPCAAVLAGGLDNTSCFDVLGYQNPHGDEFTHDFQPARQDEYRTDSEVINVTVDFDYEFEWATLTSVTGYIDMDRLYGENTWSQPSEIFAAVHDEQIEQFSQELRLAGETGIANWLAGVYFSTDEIEADNLANSGDLFGPFFGASPVLWPYEQETTAYAVFGSIDWALTDQLTLVTGLRYTDEEIDFTGVTSGVLFDDPSVVLPLNCPTYDADTFTCLDASSEFTDDNVSWRVVLEYRPTDNLLGYVSAASGFKSGGFNGDFVIDEGGYDPYDSETLLAYELGGKATVIDGRVQINAAVFLYDYDDYQTLIPVPPPAVGFQLGNLSGADIWGLDLEVAARPVDNVDLRVGLGYLDTEISDALVDPSGDELPNSPEWQVTGGARYEIPVAGDWSLVLQGDVKYTDSMFRTLTPSLTSGLLSNNGQGQTDSYTVVNARLALTQPAGPWEFAVWARNLNDEDYFIEAFDLLDPLGTTAKLAGAPRTWGGTVIYRFQ